MAEVKRGQRITAKMLNEALKSAQRTASIAGGGGVQVVHTAAGITVTKGGEKRLRAAMNTTNVLGHTQGVRNTDKWTRGASSNGKGIREYDWTDFFYDNTAHALYGRQRIKFYDAEGHLMLITEEDEPVVIVQFVQCEAQP